MHYNWHWHWDYGNGDVGNQGVHETDMCLWGLGLETLPTDIVAMGGKFLWDDDKETPEVLTSSYFFPDTNQMIEFEVRPWYTNTEAGVGVGNLFYGSDGWLVIKGYNNYELYMKGDKEPKSKKSDGDPVGKHFANFINAVRSRDASTLHGPVETAHTSSGLAHLGNIAYRLGRKLKFDPANRTIRRRHRSRRHANPQLPRPLRGAGERLTLFVARIKLRFAGPEPRRPGGAEDALRRSHQTRLRRP